MTMQAVRAAALTLMTLFATAALAQQYPTRPVKVLVSIPPGGAPDIAARLLAQKLTEALGQPVLVENRPGANGNVAGDIVAKATPDGHTLILIGDSLAVINPHIYSKMPFDTLKDIVPVASVASNQFFLSVNPSVPVKTFPEFIEYARKTKPPLPYASGGNGSQHHLGTEMLKQRAGIDLTHVPYRGGAPAGTATVAGETMVVPGWSIECGIAAGGPIARTRDHRKKAFAAVSRSADHRRVLSRLRRDDLARPVRAGGYARADPGQAARRGEQGAG